MLERINQLREAVRIGLNAASRACEGSEVSRIGRFEHCLRIGPQRSSLVRGGGRR